MEDVTKLAETLNQKIADIESKALNSATKTEVETLKESLKAVATKEDVTKLSDDLDLLATKIAGITEGKKNKSTSINKQFAEIANKGFEKDKTASHVVKADNALNLFAVAGEPFANDEINIDAAILSRTATDTGISARLNGSMAFIMELARFARPLEIGEALKKLVPYDESGTPIVVAELKTKPRGSVKYKEQKEESKKVAIEWVLSREFQQRAAFLLSTIGQNFNDLLMESFQKLVFDDLDGKAEAFVLPTGFTPVTEANNYDALNAVVASMVDEGYNPTHVVLNGVDFANMFSNKGIDGHYSLTNNGSIQLINGGTTLIVGGHSLSVIKTDKRTMAAGNLLMIDISKLEVGIRPSVDYQINPYEYFSQNAVVNQLETAFAILVPENTPYAVVNGTFADIIAEIEAAPIP